MKVSGKKQFHQLTEQALHACQVARDETRNLIDLLESGSTLAFLAVKECEKELDQIERRIDEEIPRAISRVGEEKARELLSALKFITDLERIGDLLLWVAARVQGNSVPAEAAQKFKAMINTLDGMLANVHRGFITRDLSRTRAILGADKKINEICHSFFRANLQISTKQNGQLEIVLMAQALERAGDHATNLGEALHHFIEGHSIRHAPAKRRATVEST